MVDIDIIGDRSSVAGRDDIETSIRAAIEFLITLVTEPNAPYAFANRYWRYVQDDPHVAMAHAALKRVLYKWPAPQSREQVSFSQHRKKVRDVVRKHKE